MKRKVEGIDLAEQVASLTVRVKANENFEEGPEEYAVYKFVWCDYLIQPAGGRSVLRMLRGLSLKLVINLFWIITVMWICSSWE